jgi:hypothetical protein
MSWPHRTTNDIRFLTRQAMYVSRNTEARSRNHCYSGKAISITYLCVCVCVCVRVRARAYGCACVGGCGCPGAGD